MRMTDYLDSFFRSIGTSSECKLRIVRTAQRMQDLKFIRFICGPKRILIAAFNPLSEVSGIREDVGNLMLVYQAMEQVREWPDGV